ncbi:MAG TPA: nucleotidyl transferase AbiEii/AbiGii toxin family protein [Thermoanaerobaculia bacterium]|jgi:hypothetical protein
MIFHEEILTGGQRKTLRLLGPRSTADGFYLAGGTAIALHLGHRRSVDFDWFPGAHIHGVRVSFLEFRYRMLDALLTWPEYGCRLAGLRDLACMKLSAIAQRGSRKDFVDLHALGRHGFRLRDMLEWYQTKFEVQDIGHVLYALAYFDIADSEPRPRMLWKSDWKDVKRTILSWVREL